MSRLAPIAAVTVAALTAWVSQGTLGFESPDGARIGILPLSLASLVVAIGAAAGVVALWRAGASLLPTALLVIVLLPWAPCPAPAAFLIWSGPAAWLIWIAVSLLMLASLPRRRHLTVFLPVAVAAALAIFALSAWRVAPMIPGGDEPHYLVITQSLLSDGDLSIEDVHRRGDYRAYYAGDLPPHVQRRGRDGQIYSVHAPGLPVLVAPAFAIGGYPAVVTLLVVLAAAGSGLAWRLARMAADRDGAAWFGWAAVTFPVTTIFQSFTVYPDGVGGILALTGLWALLRAQEESKSGATRALPWLLHGAALAALPWFHSRFAVIAGGFGALVLLRLSTTKNPAAKAVAFLSIPAVSAILWVGYFIAVYGTPDPSAPYGPGEIGSFAFVPGGLGGLLFDQRFGLIAYAPVLGFALGALVMMLARPEWRRLALELLFVIVPYLLTVTHFAMWWGGWSPPARFFAPVLPLLVVPAAVGWTMIEHRATRVLASASLALTALASLAVIGVDRGRMAFNTRQAPGLWLEWAGRLADLTAAAPLWARDTDVPLFRAISIWIAVLVGAWLLLRTVDVSARLRDRTSLQTAAVAAIAVAIMTASTVVWAFEGSNGRRPVVSQLELLEALAAEPRVLAVALDRASRVPARQVPGRLRIEMSRTASIRPTGRDATMFSVPPLPAGEYRVTVVPEGAPGWLMIGIARDQFALHTIQLPAASMPLRFPLPVRGLVVRGDEEAQRVVGGLAIEPVSILRPDDRLTSDMARRAVRYGDATVFFLDDRSFPEPDGFWVGGARESRVVVQSLVPRNAMPLILRNGPVENTVTLEADGWRRDLRLAAGEERRIDVPLDSARGGLALRIVSSTGFRPSEHDATSGDERFLGVWMRPER
ncbi:MAG: hypothetical protein ACRD1U_14245 [Vicinamibacterales bacterium]